MEIEDLKQYIKSALLTRTGVINVAITRRDHFINSEIAKDIISATSSLDIYNPSLGDRIKAILTDYEFTKCPVCQKPVKLFHPTCGNKNCRNISISNKKQQTLSLNPLENNDDELNKIEYSKLSNTDVVNITNECLEYIENNLRKRNDHLNIERISRLNITNHVFVKNICILTYFCDNHKQFDIYRRIKLVLLDIQDLEYCSCGNIKGLSDEAIKMFLPSCGKKECVYKIVANHTKNNSERVSIIKRNNREKRETLYREQFNTFIENIDNFQYIEYDKFRDTLLQISRNKETNYNILGSNLSYFQFFNNTEIMKNLLYHTRYISINIDNLGISQRAYHILNDLKEIPKCKKCNGVLCNFLSPSIGYSTYCIDCRCRDSVSKIELSLVEFVKSLNIPIQHSNRTIIAPLELDIVIPSKKLAIEFNGNYWHSEQRG